MGNYALLIQKLDQFIRKYYANKLLRGSLICAACLILYLLMITLGEYYFYFPVWVKVGVLSLLVLVGLLAVIRLVIIPLLKMQQMGPVISHEQASGIIGLHFPEVSDKLLNILQLRQESGSAASKALIEASIQQKSAQIVVVPFAQAIDLKQNKKYLPYLVLPLLLVGIILLAAPHIFKDAASRLMQPTTAFSPPAPFAFHIGNKQLRVPLYGQFVLDVEVKGEKLPDRVFLNVEGEQLELQALSKTHFQYTFSRVSEPLTFHLSAAGVRSPGYTLSIMEQPRLTAFSVSVNYPDYTGRTDEVLQGLSDLQLPQGTVLQWEITTSHTDQAQLRFGTTGQPLDLSPAGKDKWQASARFDQDTVYSFLMSNSKFQLKDSFRYGVQVIADQHPQVSLQQLSDSLLGQQILLVGNASDDYGLSRLYFHYEVKGEQNATGEARSIPLKLTPGKVVAFQQYFDFGSLNLEPGQRVSYYVEAWDNDAVHGSKSGRSAVGTFSMPRLDELQEQLQENAEQINQGLSAGAAQSEQMQEDVKSLQNQLLQTDDMSWEKKQGFKQLTERQEQLMNQVAAVKKRFEEQMKNTERKDYSEDIREKQEAVKEQLDHLLDKQLAEELKRLQEMMQKLNKEDAFQQLQQMEQQNKLFNMDMARIQELMKQLEMQMKMEDMAGKIGELATQEGKLKEKTEQGSADKDALAREQDKIKKALESLLKEDMQELGKMNNAQQAPQDLDGAQEQGEQAKDQMEQSSQQLQQGQPQKAGQAQSKAKQQLEEMAASMMQMAQGGNLEQIELDIKATRQLLTNLIRLSFEQEKLMNSVKTTPPSSPLFLTNAQVQNRLVANAKMIKDSLFVLSKRVFQIAPTINKETTELERNMAQTVTALGNRRMPEAVSRQQYAMTNANNLALLLNELLENLMQQQAQAMGQSGSGKPKQGQGGGPGQLMKDIITGQQQLGEGMKPGQGNQPGQQGSSGKSGGQGGEGGDAEQIARMARQQAALRKQIQELSSLLNSKGMGGNARELKAIQEQMDKNEADMVNKRFNSALLQRQRDIMTRLLSAEKAIRNQEEDNKRTAKEGKDENRPMPPEFEQYLKDHQQMKELYKTVPPSLKPFYKKMAEAYLNEVKPAP